MKFLFAFLLILFVSILYYIFVIKKRKTFVIVFLFLLLLVGILIIFLEENATFVFCNPLLIFAIFILCYKIYLNHYKDVRNKIYKIDAYNDLVTLHRDIDVSYNPSVVGYLLNHNLTLRDLSADIMNLYAKKIINVETFKENNNKYKCKPFTQNSFEEPLSSSDYYLLNTLVFNKRTFNNSYFSFSEWKDLVVKDYRQLNFSKKINHTNTINKLNNMSFSKIFTLLFVIIIFFSLISYIIFRDVFHSFIIGMVSGFSFSLIGSFFLEHLKKEHNIDFYLNDKGKEEFKKWIKFKRFMKEYTLIKDKNSNDIIIYEKYIPYSVSLSIIKDYSNTIFEVFNNFEIDKILDEIKEVNNI